MSTTASVSAISGLRLPGPPVSARPAGRCVIVSDRLGTPLKAGVHLGAKGFCAGSFLASALAERPVTSIRAT